ncbi:11770_t:CDS:1, partial [Dentiscutata heterogama]
TTPTPELSCSTNSYDQKSYQKRNHRHYLNPEKKHKNLNPHKKRKNLKPVKTIKTITCTLTETVCTYLPCVDNGGLCKDTSECCFGLSGNRYCNSGTCVSS